MIRSVIMVDLKPGTTDEQVAAFHDALVAIPFERRSAFTFGRDLDLVDNTVDIVMISDFDDEQAYRDWAVDEGHRRVSAQYLKPIAERITRGQIVV
ncbi:hypothetical protein GCM10009682_56330 [Luedemannella flava]|uniref:Stress-response A/B barrel domain-containing protein n=1 Tax=Luedemannella flava TaxID=349316 RepID=A0ABP4YY41_9ACTN